MFNVRMNPMAINKHDNLTNTGAGCVSAAIHYAKNRLLSISELKDPTTKPWTMDDIAASLVDNGVAFTPVSVDTLPCIITDKANDVCVIAQIPDACLTGLIERKWIGSYIAYLTRPKTTTVIIVGGNPAKDTLEILSPLAESGVTITIPLSCLLEDRFIYMPTMLHIQIQ